MSRVAGCNWCFLGAALSLVSALPAAAQYGRCSLDDKPLGFASIAGGTTGGAGGRMVTAKTFDSLELYMNSAEKLIIQVSGTIALPGMVSLRGDKTLIGLGDNAKLINGGLEIYKRKNIIIRNITFENAPDDLLKVNQETTHLWVDHCTFTDGAFPDPKGEAHDGLFDITRQSNYITISHCMFTNHSKCILIGHSDSYAQDKGYLKTTMHHNWFKGSIQRHPRVRFAEVHCFNNFYDGNTLYGVASTMDAAVVVEGNHFLNVPFPTYVGYAESPDGELVERANMYIGSGVPETKGTAFDPSKYYAYNLDAASAVPAKVKANAGAGGTRTVSVWGDASRGLRHGSISVSVGQDYRPGLYAGPDGGGGRIYSLTGQLSATVGEAPLVQSPLSQGKTSESKSRRNN